MKQADWIIAIRLRQLGDLLATLEPLRALRAHSADCRVALIADGQFHPLLARYDFVDRLIPGPPGPGAAYARYIRQLRALRPRAAVDFHGSVRSALLALLCGARTRVGFDMRGRKIAYTIVERRQGERDGRLGPTTAIALGGALVAHLGAGACAEAIPAMPVTEAERHDARTVLEKLGAGPAGRRVIGLNPGRAYPSKAWSNDRFVSLARALAAEGCAVIVMWGPGEREIARDIVTRAGDAGVHLAPETSLHALPGLLQNLALLITIDSGLKHLAVAARVPTVTMFGSTDPREWHMGTASDVVVWKGFSCSPCRRAECPLGNTPCMDHGVSDVRDAALRILAG